MHFCCRTTHVLNNAVKFYDVDSVKSTLVELIFGLKVSIVKRSSENISISWSFQYLSLLEGAKVKSCLAFRHDQIKVEKWTCCYYRPRYCWCSSVSATTAPRVAKAATAVRVAKEATATTAGAFSCGKVPTNFWERISQILLFCHRSLKLI